MDEKRTWNLSYMASNELMLQGSGFSKFSNEISFFQTRKMGGFFMTSLQILY
jgi:hypothetical protein